MSQWLLVYIIIAVSVIYIIYKVWQSLHQKQKDGCTGYCAGCPFATNANRNHHAHCNKEMNEERKKKNISKKQAKSLEE